MHKKSIARIEQNAVNNATEHWSSKHHVAITWLWPTFSLCVVDFNGLRVDKYQDGSTNLSRPTLQLSEVNLHVGYQINVLYTYIYIGKSKIYSSTYPESKFEMNEKNVLITSSMF